MIKEEDLPKVKGRYIFNSRVPNWFDLKGRAEVLFKPFDSADLSFFLKNINSNVPVQIIGAGSNVIIVDEGIKGVLIKLPASFSEINFDKEKCYLKIGCATLCQNVAQYCINYGLSGLEFLSGIPGTIGGAIAMNAGCYGEEISGRLLQSEALDYNGNFYNFENKDFGFYYRGSKIGKNFLFTSGVFKVEVQDIDKIATKVNILKKQREESQPIRAKTGGSTFKNPVGKKAWELIDEVGYRGKVVGGARFSEKHCNFMINAGGASAKDLISLSEGAKNEVLNKLNVNLELEIKILK